MTRLHPFAGTAAGVRARGARALLLLAAGLCLTPLTAAQTNTGTSIGDFLLIEPSARLSAMGNAGVTMADEVAAGYFNPAALGALSESDAQFSHAEWFAGIAYDHAAVGLKVGQGTLQLAATSLRSGEIDVRTEDQPLGTGERYDTNSLALGIGYGRRITDRFTAGANVALVNETIWRSSMTALSIGVGVRYELASGGPVLGASLSNLGTKGRYDGIDLSARVDPDPDASGTNSNLPARLTTDAFSLPTAFRVGIGWPIRIGRDSRVLLAVDALQPSYNTESLSVGGEWTYRELISARAGYQNLFQTDLEGGLTLGGGLKYAVSGVGLRVDYAWSDFGRLGDVQRFSFGVSF